MARGLLLRICAAGAAPGAAGAWLRAGQGAAAPAPSWERGFGQGQAVMDAFLYPDPSAPEPVLAAARRQCIAAPHVMMVGTNTRKFMEEDGLVEFDCRFRLPGGVSSDVPGWFYSDRNRTCPGRSQDEQYAGRDHTLACEVPLPLLTEGFSRAEVLLVRRDNGSAFSTPILARGLMDGSGTSAALGQQKRYRLAVTNMYRNAGAQIATWLEWHIAKGVEHFFLYDNGSDEKDQVHLEPYVDRGLVTRVPWAYCCKGDSNNVGQRGSMNHALMKFGQTADWLISLDQDEFLISPSVNKSIPDILDEGNYDKPGVAISYSLMARGSCPVESGSPDAMLMGAVLTSRECPPTLTRSKYPGKYFVRPSRMYELGFLYTTPHPFHGLDLAWSFFAWSLFREGTGKMAIAHFRRQTGDARAAEECAEGVTTRRCVGGGPFYKEKAEWLRSEHAAFARAWPRSS